MKNSLLKVVFILIAVAFMGTLSSCGYNSMVAKRENVDGEWSKVQSAYQRRSDLIPNLIETVKGSAKFEQETLEKVVAARSRATSIQLSADDLTEENLAKFQAAQAQLSGALSRLLAVSENYPDLKTTEAFRDLQAQLEGTENRINTERNNFNEAVKDYNAFIQQFPRNFTASWFKFEKKAYFKADAGTEVAPKVKF